MDWNLSEALICYQVQGAPGDQTALVGLLKEMQAASGGSISPVQLAEIAQYYQIRESLLLAIIKRMPSLHLAGTHRLEICAGPACERSKQLRDYLKKNPAPSGVEVKFTGCMRQCGQGPNLKWDGILYNAADPALLRRLLGSI